MLLITPKALWFAIVHVMKNGKVTSRVLIGSCAFWIYRNAHGHYGLLLMTNTHAEPDVRRKVKNFNFHCVIVVFSKKKPRHIIIYLLT